MATEEFDNPELMENLTKATKKVRKTAEAVTAADILEETGQVIEDTLELMEAKWFKNPKFLIAVAFGTGLVIGAGATYLVAKRRITSQAEQRANAEIEDVKNHYSAIHKTDGPSLEERAAQYAEETKAINTEIAASIIEREGYTAYEQVPSAVETPASPVDQRAAGTVIEQSRVVTTVVREEMAEEPQIDRNVFESDNPDIYFNFMEEIERRSAHPNEPFVISRDEFEQGEADFEQTQLTYYDGDDVLCDSVDKPVDDIDKVVGFANILRFGCGSGDPNVVYVRNTRLSLDFEVTQSKGSYAKEVHGFDNGDELQHSDKRKPRRFRASDE